MNTNCDFQPHPSPPDQETSVNFNPQPSSPNCLTPAKHHHKNPKKKRSKLIKINNTATTGVSKPKYTKKPDPSAPKITRPCTECGKTFWSWKALFGHMRCHPERQWRGINPPPNVTRLKINNAHDFESSIMTEDDKEVAMCLLKLANGPSAYDSPTLTTIGYQDLYDSEMGAGPSDIQFGFSSSKKVFGSRQALVGHRATNKNIKGCFSITRNDGPEEPCINGEVEDKGVEAVMGHRCGICLRVFSSGQALGGHKRCHWEKGDEPSSLITQGLNLFATKEACGLDLNMPAPPQDESCSSYSSGLSLDLRLGL